VAVINLVEATHDGSPTYCQTLGTQLARLQRSIRLQHPGRVTNAKSNVSIGNHDVNGSNANSTARIGCTQSQRRYVAMVSAFWHC
jgi:hypothetical protein